jgi:mannose-6-phosphate isomerase-like protein (cupin superfamily)
MAVLLEGGCRVAALHDGEPLRDGALRVWSHGGGAVSLRVLDLDGSTSLRNDACDEVLYVIGGAGTATLDGTEHPLAPDSGIYLPPQSTLSIRSQAPMTIVSVQCGEQAPSPVSGPVPNALHGAVVSLTDRPLQRTGDRWYREIINDEVGSTQVTQFVGIIPPGRAPDHYHLYEEVICILDGHGMMWAGETSTPVKPGSCIFLPRRQLHCVENRGPGDLRLLGVFYPAGSPAVRYSPG